MQLFFQGKELRADVYDGRTLEEMNLHTGFSLMGYDLSEAPDYFPPVFLTPSGLQFKLPIHNPGFLHRHPTVRAQRPPHCAVARTTIIPSSSLDSPRS